MSHSTSSAVGEAAAAARAAVASAPHHDRAAWLGVVAAVLDEHAEELVPLAEAETHLGDTRLNGELARPARSCGCSQTSSAMASAAYDPRTAE
jgi:acyl-CoA reductase-like NAD-dependent aldehyde dehydrogenase